MAKLRQIGDSDIAYRDMIASLFPRGPIWDLTQPGVAGMTGGLGVEATRFHNRLVDLMLEAFPATADELLDEWEEAFGLPLCSVPEDDDGRRLALAGKVAAQGGQSRAYFIDLAWAVLSADGEYSRVEEPDLVTITERPFGDPFVAWGSDAWDLLGGRGARFYWRINLPGDVSAAKEAIIECLLCRYKPAHTVLVRANGTVVCETPGEPDPPTELGVYYDLPGSGTDDLAVATTSAAPQIIAIETSVLFWMRVISADEGAMVFEVLSTQGESLYYMGLYLAAGGDFVLEASVYSYLQDGTSPTSGGIAFGAFDFYSLELGDDGAMRVYRNATLILTTTGDPPDPGAGLPDPYLRFRGTDGNAVHVTNIMPLARVLTSAERSALYAAGPQHDYREATGDWAGVAAPPVYWRDADESGVVPNAGVGGTCGLELQGDATTQEF